MNRSDRPRQMLLNRLGLAQRAGRLISGEDSILKAMRSGKVKLVVLAEDASANTAKRYRDKCSHYGIPLIQYGTREELGASIGRDHRAALAVTDEGFAGLIRKSLQIPSEVKDIEQTGK